MAIYYIINSSKGIASIVLARWIGVSQKTAWKMGHAIRAMMVSNSEMKRRLAVSSKLTKPMLVVNQLQTKLDPTSAAKAPTNNLCL